MSNYKEEACNQLLRILTTSFVTIIASQAITSQRSAAQFQQSSDQTTSTFSLLSMIGPPMIKANSATPMVSYGTTKIASNATSTAICVTQPHAIYQAEVASIAAVSPVAGQEEPPSSLAAGSPPASLPPNPPASSASGTKGCLQRTLV